VELKAPVPSVRLTFRITINHWCGWACDILGYSGQRQAWWFTQVYLIPPSYMKPISNNVYLGPSCPQLTYPACLTAVHFDFAAYQVIRLVHLINHRPKRIFRMTTARFNIQHPTFTACDDRLLDTTTTGYGYTPSTSTTWWTSI